MCELSSKFPSGTRYKNCCNYDGLPPLKNSPLLDIKSTYFMDQLKGGPGDAVDLETLMRASINSFPLLWCEKAEKCGKQSAKLPRHFDYPLLIRNLPYQVPREAVRKLCSKYGCVSSCSFIKRQKNEVKGHSQCIVKFRDLSSVFCAASKLNETQFMSRKIYVEPGEQSMEILDRIGAKSEEFVKSWELAKKNREDSKTIPLKEKQLIWRLSQQWIVFNHDKANGISLENLLSQVKHIQPGPVCSPPIYPQCPTEMPKMVKELYESSERISDSA